MGKCAWISTQDAKRFATSNLSPMQRSSGADNQASSAVVGQDGEKFQMLDKTTIISGCIVGEYTGSGPLDEYGRDFGYAASYVEVNGRADALILPGADAGGLITYIYGRLSTTQEPARTYLAEVEQIGLDERRKPSECNGGHERDTR